MHAFLAVTDSPQTLSAPPQCRVPPGHGQQKAEGAADLHWQCSSPPDPSARHSHRSRASSIASCLASCPQLMNGLPSCVSMLRALTRVHTLPPPLLRVCRPGSAAPTRRQRAPSCRCFRRPQWRFRRFTRPIHTIQQRHSPQCSQLHSTAVHSLSDLARARAPSRRALEKLCGLIIKHTHTLSTCSVAGQRPLNTLQCCPGGREAQQAAQLGVRGGKWPMGETTLVSTASLLALALPAHAPPPSLLLLGTIRVVETCGGEHAVRPATSSNGRLATVDQPAVLVLGLRKERWAPTKPRSRPLPAHSSLPSTPLDTHQATQPPSW